MVLVCAGIGCRSDPVNTGLRVEVTMGGVMVDQLRFSVSNSKGFLHNANHVLRPQTPAGLLADPQIIEIYVSEALDGTSVTWEVEGLLNGQAVVGRTDNIKVQRRLLLPVLINLGADRDGGADSRPDGDSAVDRPGDAVAADRSADADAADPRTDGGLAPLGTACKQAADCASGLCVDTVCCDSSICGNCRACNVTGKAGTCAPVAMSTPSAMCVNQKMNNAPCGYDGTCDGLGGCYRPGAGHPCGAAAACNGANVVPTSACDGQGNCAPAVQVSCAPYGCNTAAATCRTTCTVNADCAPNTQCTKNSCGTVQKKAIGAGCLADGDCTSNFCTDGVCCNVRCEGMCESCAATAPVGTCNAVPAGKADPNGICKDAGVASCGTNGLCDGARGCARYASGVVCQQAQCLGHAILPQEICNAGACTVPAQMDCGGYRCDPATVTCLTSCTTDAQCATELGDRCRGGHCH